MLVICRVTAQKARDEEKHLTDHRLYALLEARLVSLLRAVAGWKTSRCLVM